MRRQHRQSLILKAGEQHQHVVVGLGRRGRAGLLSPGAAIVQRCLVPMMTVGDEEQFGLHDRTTLSSTLLSVTLQSRCRKPTSS